MAEQLTPRVVRTVEELRNMPEGTALRLADGSLGERKTWSDGRPGVKVAGSRLGYQDEDWSLTINSAPTWANYLPATVLAPLPVASEQVDDAVERLFAEVCVEDPLSSVSRADIRSSMTRVLAAMGIPVVDNG